MEYLNEISFMGLFAILWMAMGYIYILSTKISELLNRVETIEGVMDITKKDSGEMIDRLEKIKIAIEGSSAVGSLKGMPALNAKVATL